MEDPLPTTIQFKLLSRPEIIRSTGARIQNLIVKMAWQYEHAVVASHTVCSMRPVLSRGRGAQAVEQAAFQQDSRKNLPEAIEGYTATV